MFTVTEGNESREMDFVMPLDPIRLWKKAEPLFICSSDCMWPTQHSSVIFTKRARTTPPPRGYDWGSHMATAPSQKYSRFFTNSCSTAVSDEQLKSTLSPPWRDCKQPQPYTRITQSVRRPSVSSMWCKIVQWKQCALDLLAYSVIFFGWILQTHSWIKSTHGGRSQWK